MDDVRDDDALMRRAADGDAQAFGLIVRAYQGRLVRFAARLLGDSEAAQDAAQEAFLRLWRLRVRYQPRGCLQAYLLRTVQGVIAQNLLRRADGPGRVAANEILIGTPRVRRMIADGQTDPALLALAMEASAQDGMQTMDDALLAYYTGGVISRASAEGYLKEKGRVAVG